MILNALLYLLTLAVGTAIGLFLRSYLGEKGRNLATREDIQAITRAVEAARIEYLRDIEETRSKLARANTVFAAQYEAESRIYAEVWERLIEVQTVTTQLRPMLDVGLAPGETAEARKFARLEAFGQAFNAFTAVVWKRRPFYPERLYNELVALTKIVHGEAVDYQFGDPSQHDDYWHEAHINAKTIGDQIDKICTAIRERLEVVGAG